MKKILFLVLAMICSASLFANPDDNNNKDATEFSYSNTVTDENGMSFRIIDIDHYSTWEGIVIYEYTLLCTNYSGQTASVNFYTDTKYIHPNYGELTEYTFYYSGTALNGNNLTYTVPTCSVPYRYGTPWITMTWTYTLEDGRTGSGEIIYRF